MRTVLLAGLALGALTSTATHVPAVTADFAGLLDRAAAQHAARDYGATLATVREALHAAWLDAPLGVTKAVLVTEESRGYGRYEPRSSNRYAPGEPTKVYVEPAGYKYRRDGDLWRFGIGLDWVVLDMSGNVLGGKQGIGRKDFASRNRNTELVLDITYTLTKAPPGTYVLRTTMRDLYGGGQASFDNEIEIVPTASG